MTIGPGVALFQVFDMTESLAFYDRLGFVVIDHSPYVDDAGQRYVHWCRLRRDRGELMLNTLYESIADRPAARDVERARRHDSCLYFTCDDADALHAQWVAADVAGAPPADTPYGMRQLYLTDPDGHGLCFQHRIAA